MEQDDWERTLLDRSETVLERIDVARRLCVDLPQQRLAEVPQRAAGKAADEALRTDDAELRAVQLRDRPRAFEDDDARVLEHSGQLGDLVRVIVVISEDGVDGRGERAAGIREDASFFRLAVQSQVPGEQDDV